MLRRTLYVIGCVLVSAGLLLLLFTAYQLWGTNLTEASHQSALRSKLAHELPPSAVVQAHTHRVTSHAAPASQPLGPPVTAPTTAAPAEGQPVGRLQIPSIGLNQVIVEGVGTNDLMMGPGHYPGTALPGQAGNVAIAGHRTTYGHPFYNLNAVPTGASVIITTPQGVFVYKTRNIQVVSPNDVNVVSATTTPQLTLTTCNPLYSASTRLVLKGTLAGSSLFQAKGPASPTTTTLPQHPTGGAGLAGDGGGSWVSTTLWGLAVVAVAVATWFVARSLRRRRWPVYLVGTLGLLVVLFFFFGAVSPLLPATF